MRPRLGNDTLSLLLHSLGEKSHRNSPDSRGKEIDFIGCELLGRCAYSERWRIGTIFTFYRSSLGHYMYWSLYVNIIHWRANMCCDYISFSVVSMSSLNMKNKTKETSFLDFIHCSIIILYFILVCFILDHFFPIHLPTMGFMIAISFLRNAYFLYYTYNNLFFCCLFFLILIIQSFFFFFLGFEDIPESKWFWL